jgi:hypothetical protein
VTSTLTNLARTALDVPLWTVGFVTRHVLVIAALAAVPVVERATAVLWATSRPTGLAMFADLVTLSFRLLLLAVVISLIRREEPGLRVGVGRPFLDGVVGHWPLLLTSIAMFVLVFAVLNLAGPGLGLLVDAARSTRYELAVFTFRNAVIIPLAVVWMCGIARQLLLAAR